MDEERDAEESITQDQDAILAASILMPTDKAIACYANQITAFTSAHDVRLNFGQLLPHPPETTLAPTTTRGIRQYPAAQVVASVVMARPVAEELLYLLARQMGFQKPEKRANEDD